MSLGLCSFSASYDSPMRAAAPGARFCTSTSAVFKSCSSASFAWGCFTSSARLSLLRLIQVKWDDWPRTRWS